MLDNPLNKGNPPDHRRRVEVVELEMGSGKLLALAYAERLRQIPKRSKLATLATLLKNIRRITQDQLFSPNSYILVKFRCVRSIQSSRSPTILLLVRDGGVQDALLYAPIALGDAR